MEKITVVVPCYNEEESLPIFYEEMERVRKQDFNNLENEQKIEFEYIFVDDGSKDGTLNEMKQLSQVLRLILVFEENNKSFPQIHIGLFSKFLV